MASLSSLIQTKSAIAQISEENLDKGQVFVFAHGTYTQNFRCQFCWIAPSNGTATIEIWGAGGSASRMCCCGIGIPGNPGAYAKKTVAITSGPSQFFLGLGPFIAAHLEDTAVSLMIVI